MDGRPAPLLILAGPPGAGKSTVARIVAAADDPSVCLDRAVARRDEPPRAAGHPPLGDTGPIRHMWQQFADIGP